MLCTLRMNKYYYQPIKDGRTHWGNRGWTAGLCQKGTLIECHVARQYDCPGIGIPESIFFGTHLVPDKSHRVQSRMQLVTLTLRHMYICLASEAWAQAGRVSERGCEEQPLFMMVEDIVGDVYEPDVPQTSMGSARLVQICDNYAAATLAHFQADALPPHIPLDSSASQSNQPPPEQRQSTDTHPPCNTEELCPARSAKYERISLSKVGARQCDESNTGDDCQNKRQPPEQQADEARFRLQNVVTRPRGRRECESAPPPIDCRRLTQRHGHHSLELGSSNLHGCCPVCFPLPHSVRLQLHMALQVCPLSK